MLTEFNAKQLMLAYDMKHTAFHETLYNHRRQLDKLATYYTTKSGKKAKRQNYNVVQLKFIIEKVMGDVPYGYIYNGTTLIKKSEE